MRIVGITVNNITMKEENTSSKKIFFLIIMNHRVNNINKTALILKVNI